MTKMKTNTDVLLWTLQHLWQKCDVRLQFEISLWT